MCVSEARFCWFMSLAFCVTDSLWHFRGCCSDIMIGLCAFVLLLVYLLLTFVILGTKKHLNHPCNQRITLILLLCNVCVFLCVCISLKDVCFCLCLCVPLIGITVCRWRLMYWQETAIFYSLATRLMPTLITWPELPSALVNRKSIDLELSDLSCWFFSKRQDV